ncbi:MAG: chemotaxis protein CheW [Myxococcota bacterium]
MSNITQICTFYLGELYLGIDVLEVQEVIRAQEMTEIPLTAETIGGLINLRGQIVTAVEMRCWLGLPPREGPPMNVVIHVEDATWSLLVDEIGDVIEVDSATFEPCPETLDPVLQEMLVGVHKLPERLLLLLNIKEFHRMGMKQSAA